MLLVTEKWSSAAWWSFYKWVGWSTFTFSSHLLIVFFSKTNVAAVVKELVSLLGCLHFCLVILVSFPRLRALIIHSHWRWLLVWRMFTGRAPEHHVPPGTAPRSAPFHRPAMPGALPMLSSLRGRKEKTGYWGLGTRGTSALHFLYPVLCPRNACRTCHRCYDHCSHTLVPRQIGYNMPDLTASWNTDIFLNALEITAAQSSE